MKGIDFVNALTTPISMIYKKQSLLIGSIIHEVTS